MSFQALPGFRDFYPAEMAIRRHVEGTWHAAARAAGFEEIDGPPLESLELLKAKSGDAIVDEIYAFEDKGGRGVGLRPELTPTLGRMVASRAAALKKPTKWYAVPQLFRYQRQQRGRLREHIQWNVDVIGSPDVAAEAEIVAVAIDALARLGLTHEDIYVRAFDRQAADHALDNLGIENKTGALQLIDRGKLDTPAAEETLGAGPAAALREWFHADFTPEGSFAEFLEACDSYGLAKYVTVDKSIVRGLAYYTGTVFEIFDRGHKLRAIAGGGRYDTLVETLGGPPTPALGFGMGDVVITELLKDLGRLPKHPPRINTLVVPIGDEMLGAAREVVRRLRDAGDRAEAPYVAMKLNKAFKIAEQSGATRIVLVGPDEWADGKVQVKQLESGRQETVAVDDMA